MYMSLSVYAEKQRYICIHVLYMHVCISMILLELKNFTAKIISYAQSWYLFAFVFIIISVIGSTCKYRYSWLIPTTCLVEIYREGNNTYLISSSFSNKSYDNNIGMLSHLVFCSCTQTPGFFYRKQMPFMRIKLSHMERWMANCRCI